LIGFRDITQFKTIYTRIVFRIEKVKIALATIVGPAPTERQGVDIGRDSAAAA
jgi:hypothetical protein